MAVQLCDCCEMPLGEAVTGCPHCGAQFASPAVGASLPVKRYDLVTNYRCGSSIEEMERNDEDGEWLRWEAALEMTDRIRLEHAEWDKTRVSELQDLRQRHHDLKAALLALQTEMEQLIEEWRSYRDNYSEYDACADDLEQKVAQLKQLRER